MEGGKQGVGLGQALDPVEVAMVALRDLYREAAGVPGDDRHHQELGCPLHRQRGGIPPRRGGDEVVRHSKGDGGGTRYPHGRVEAAGEANDHHGGE